MSEPLLTPRVVASFKECYGLDANASMFRILPTKFHEKEVNDERADEDE